MNKHDAIYFPAFDANTQLMNDCPNGPGISSYDSTNYTYNDYPDYSDIHDVYSLTMSRVEFPSGHYALTLQSLSGCNVVFNDIVYWSKAQALVEQFENEYNIIDLQDIQ